jgi:hypothetical protein
MTTTNLVVRTHVGRDLLSAAARFKTEAVVVWEYVVNSIQYVDPGVLPNVQVSIRSRKKEIVIEDNGRGLDEDGLVHYFTMHGENLERKRGGSGRGKFGTGKSAAFGIANRLNIVTRSNGRLNEVELTRQTIQGSDGREIPVVWKKRNEPTTLSNGTIITISEVFIEKIRETSIVEYVERHLQAYRTTRPLVAVNDHICEYREPDVTETFEFKTPDELHELLGDSMLKIYVSRVPLTEDDCGIAVTAGIGNLVGKEACGVERKERGNYLFGDMDVPLIEKFDSPIAPYDDSRSLQLNPLHPVVRVLIGFIGAKLEFVRQEQVEKFRKARQSEEARRLAKAAENISKILNEDFQRVSEQIAKIRAATSSKSGIAPSLYGDNSSSGDDDNEWIAGISEEGEVEDSGDGSRGGEPKGRKTTGPERAGQPKKGGKHSVDPSGGSGESRRKPKGGFVVDYAHLGADEARSKYDASVLTIIINLDHPVVESASKVGGVEDPAFRRLSYEIAFTEYAMALGYEKALQDPDMPPDDLLFEVRTTLNRVARAAASLYE